MLGRPAGIRTAGGSPPGSGRRVAAYFMIACLAAGGSGLVVSGLTVGGGNPRPPQPDPAAAPDGYGLAAAAVDAPAGGLERSTPLRVRIPAIDVDAELMRLGIDDDGEVEVPPLEQADQAGWYERGVTPGEVGNAVLIGHVDSRVGGPAVFFDLGRLRPGDRVEVLREDGSAVQFRVDGVDSFPKSDFPVELIYGPSAQPSLRLITCGGEFDSRARDYRENVVVFATLADG